MKQRLIAAMVALSLVFVAAVVLHATDGPYRPLACRAWTVVDWQWWYFECWLPPDPLEGMAD